MPGEENGTIMKKSDCNENSALQKLMSDELRPFVPEFKKVVTKDGNCKFMFGRHCWGLFCDLFVCFVSRVASSRLIDPAIGQYYCTLVCW